MPRHRLPRSLVLAGLFALSALNAAAPAPAHAATATPRIIGGPVTTAPSAPWQVYLRVADEACGGSILDATHVLTAAHCADGDGTTPIAPASSFTVLAGASDVAGWAPGKPAPAGSQAVAVSAIRVHPYYDNRTKTDDVMILTLATPLNLSGPNAKAIALAPAGNVVAPGTPVRITGFGQYDASADPDGKLRTLDLTAISDDDCRTEQSGTSAVILCAGGVGPSPCHGDSGGALTTTTPPIVQVAVYSYLPAAGCGTGPSGFTDIGAPEVRAFIDGAATIPRAARQQTAASISWPVTPVQGSPLTCAPGTWDGAPTFTYTFFVDGVGALQAGPSPVYVPTAADLGHAISCLVAASNAGGTSSARSGATPPIAADTVRPTSRITTVRCTTTRICRLTVAVGDPNSAGLVTLAGTASYPVHTTCRVRVHGHLRTRPCVKTRKRALTIAPGTAAGRYSVSIAHLPYGRISFALRATDAAGNRQASSVRTAATVKRPKAKAKHR